MPNIKVRSLNYASAASTITPFESKAAARAWLEENNLNLDGTPILLPFYNNKRVEFLNPGDKGDHVRLMGGDGVKKPLKSNLKKAARIARRMLTGAGLIPHMNKQDESIPIGKNDFLIVYQKNEANTPVGQQFKQLLSENYQRLQQRIQEAQTNDAAQINPAELTEALSRLSLNINIVAGACYFIIEDKKGNPTVYRYIFKEGIQNKKMQDFLTKEKESRINNQKMAVAVQIENNKTTKTHRIAFIKDFLAGLIVLGITAFATAGAIAIIIPFPINLIAAAIAVSAILAPGIPLLYKKTIEKNKPTIEFARAFTAKALGGDEVDSALANALQANPMEDDGHTVLVRSLFDELPFANQLDPINEEEEEEENKQPESSLGICHH